MFWIVAAAMALLVATAILLPFLRAGRLRAEPAAAYDLRVYLDQLREVDRDLARQLLTVDEAERLRAEIGRKLLDADRALQRDGEPGAGRGHVALAAGLLAALLAGAAGIYWTAGSPRMPDAPLAGRIAEANARLANRPTQAEAEARAPRLPAPQADVEYLDLVAKLRQTVAQRPNDRQGLALLAEHESRLGNAVAARQAQQRLVDLQGDVATAGDHARLAVLMAEAAGGVITRDAETQIDRALAIDPQDGQALYLRGLLMAQVDRPDLAFPIWRDLAERSGPDDPWAGPLRQLLPDLAWFAGHPDYQLPDAGGLPGPDAGAIAAAQDMTPEERQAFIAGMVQQLETRLAEQGGTPEEWARLITSLAQIGNQTHAQEIWGEAQTRFAEWPEAMQIVRSAAERSGLAGPARDVETPETGAGDAGNGALSAEAADPAANASAGVTGPVEGNATPDAAGERLPSIAPVDPAAASTGAVSPPSPGSTP